MTTTVTKWRPITPTDPENGETVMTCIDADTGDQRNEARLKRQGNLWFFPDGSMYVYYRPTHFIPDDVPNPT
jgi:hypothetical protein